MGLSCPVYWDRAIILVDLNAFFASIEQLDFPELRGQPVGVTNGTLGSCIITCSYEARHYGIKTGMRVKEAKWRCPGFIQRPARPDRYGEVSRRIMQALHDITPSVEVFSVDEAFLDVTACQHLHGTPAAMGRMVKHTILARTGLLCSVGVSGDKTTAKYAAKCQKPDGLTIIPPWEAKQCLHPLPVTQLCGIAKGIGRFLAQRGVVTCGDMASLPMSELAKRFGPLGRRIWLMCQGQDPDPIHTEIKAPKSMGHGKVMPPNTQSQEVIYTYLLHMSEKLARRLRRHHMQASHFFLAVRAQQGHWLGDKYRLAEPTYSGQHIFQLAQKMLGTHWQGQGVCQVQVTALNPQPVDCQLSLFPSEQQWQKALFDVMDDINDRYGEFSLAPARLLQRSTMPNVIAPSWKPDGHRETIR